MGPVLLDGETQFIALLVRMIYKTHSSSIELVALSSCSILQRLIFFVACSDLYNIPEPFIGHHVLCILEGKKSQSNLLKSHREHSSLMYKIE